MDGATAGMDDSQFLGSMMGHEDSVLAQPAPTAPGTPPAPAPAQQQLAVVVPPEPVGVKKKRGRPPRNKGGTAAVVAAAAKAASKKEEDEDEVVCFICFDGGDLVVCDRRGCPKVYHPACVKRDDAFFQGRSKWNCGWHICSSCEKSVHYMCYTCTFSVCKVCIKHGKFFSVRGTKGFCDTCYGTILLVEAKDEGDTKVRVDFDDRYSWEYLFKLYWLDLKGKLSLTMEELTAAKSRWNAPITYARKEKDESSDDLYDANYDGGAGSDCSSRKRKRSNSSRKMGRKNRKAHPISSTVENGETASGNAELLPKKVQSDGVVLPLDTKWASPELLEFVGHMRDGDQSFISQFDVQALLLEYIKKNDLRNPRRKSQIICDSRLHRLFRKTHVAHFEMLRLLEMHCLVSDASTVNNGNHEAINPNAAQIDASGYGEITGKPCPDRKKRVHRKMETEPLANLEDYAAIDMHNINLIYLRRSLMEDLIDDPAFSDKISGGFVRIKITDVGQKQHMYRLVKVVGTHKVSEKYSTGKKTTNFALEILNLSKKEIITMDTISNQDFTEEECKRLRQSMKYGLISRLRVGDIQEKATIFQSVRVNDRLENEKQRLGYLRDRASETGRKKELREYVEKLQLLNTSEERTRIMNEVLQVHVDSHMDPEYDSAEEMDDKPAVERNENGKRSNEFFSPIKVQNFAKKMAAAIRHPKNLSKQSTVCKLGAVRKNLHSTVGMDIPKSGTNVSSTVSEAVPLSSSPVTLSSDMEPEKVWHYKDPSGNVQGPFTLLQLSKWTTYFPVDLRVWLIFESEERSLLLTEVLSKQPKDFGQAASVRSSKTTLAGSAKHRNRSNVDMNSTLSPVGYNTSSVPERGSVHSSDDRLSLRTSSVPPKDADTDNCQIQHHNKYQQPDLQHDGVQGRRSSEWNNGHIRGDLWSPSTTQASCSGQNSIESHHNKHASRSQVQHDSKSSLQAGSVKDLDLRQEYSQTIPTQLTRRDVPSPLLALSPSESRTASSQHESSCLSSTNPSLHDELHSSITSEKAKNCAPATFVEDRGSSSPSHMLTHSERVPVCSPQPVPEAPSTAISELCKVGEIRNEQKTCEADASVASVNQSPQSKMFPDSSPDNQDIEHQYPSPMLKSESKKSDVDKSGSTPVAPATLDTKIPEHLPVTSVSPKSDLPTGEIGAIDSVSNPEKTDLSGEDSDTQEKRNNETTLVTREKSVADPASCAEAIDATDVPTGEIGATDSVSNPDKTDLSGEDSDTQEKRNNKTLVTREKSVADPACAEAIDTTDVPESVCDLPTGKIRTMDSVPYIEKTDLGGEDLNTQKECYSESTPVPREELVADPASCAQTIDVPESVSNLEKRDSKGQDSSIQKELYNESVLVASEKMVADLASCAEPIDASHVPERDLKGKDSNIQRELYSESALVTSEKMVVEPAACSESMDVSGVLQSVFNLERRDTKDKDSIIQKELFSESTLVTSEKMVVDPAPCAESVDVSDVLESVFNLERTDLKGAHSHIQKELPEESFIATRKIMVNDPASCGELVHVSGALESLSSLEKTFLEGDVSDIQKELHEVSTLVTRENMVVDPAPCGMSIDVSGPSESLTERNRGTLCMDAIAAIEEFMTTSADEEEPQCSSPIALSPWGEPSYYQGDAVDSALWGVQDDQINDMWSLLSPTPAPQHSSGAKSNGQGVHGIDAVNVTQGEIDFFQRGPTQGDAVNVTQGEINFFQRGPAPGEYWGLTEQVKSRATVAPVDVNTGLFSWQPSPSERSNTDATWSTSQNPNLYYSYGTAAPSVRTSQEASVKREFFSDFDAPSSGEAPGNNNKSWNNTSTGNANRGGQRRDRYSQISESWLLSSNNNMGRSDGTSRAAAPRAVCKFHESGYCRKGSSCNYLHR
ncbi:unnamed protein product [Alopecurus aequalis]